MSLQVTIRPEKPGDEETISEVQRLAFGKEICAQIVEKSRGSEAWLPELSLVAEHEENGKAVIVGHVLLSRMTVRENPDETGIVALGPIGVLPQYQQQGVGSAMVRAGAERAARMGFRAVVLLGSPKYYPRFGFRPARPLGLETTSNVRDPEFMVLPLRPDALDGVTGTVLFSPAFDGS